MLLSFLVKISIFSSSLPDALIFLSLVGYVVLEQLRLKDKKLAEYDAIVKELKDKQFEFDQTLKNTQASVNSVKLGIGVKSMNMQKV